MKALLRASVVLATANQSGIRFVFSQTKVLVFFLSVACATAATITAPSTSQSDVQAAISNASAGDTVVIPATPAAGVNWTQSLLINKSITLMGAGTVSPNITKINNKIPFSASGPDIMLVRIAFTAAQGDQPVRVSGIFFDNLSIPYYVHNNGYEGPDISGIQVQGFTANDYNDNFQGNAPLRQIRIDHCAFNSGKMQIHCYGYVQGVIDHNTFTDGDVGVGMWGDDSASWTRPIVAGTINAMFVEDNTFIVDNNVSWYSSSGSVWAIDHQVYNQEGARSVIRNNTFDLTKFTIDASGNYFFDEHGNQNYYNPAHWNFRGNPLIEIYGNTMKAYSAFQFMELRGGSVLCYNNTMTTSDGSMGAINLREEEMWATGDFNPLRTPSQWPGEDMMNATFFWNNTVNGTVASVANGLIQVGDPGAPDGGAAESKIILLNRDFWLTAPNSTTHTTYPQPPPPSLSSYPLVYAAITSYTPFTYPHPFVTAAGSSTPVSPLAPAGVHITR
jgi:hypothetical protein